MSDSQRRRTAGGSRLKATWGALLAASAAAAVTLLGWGTRWTVPQAGDASAGYKLAGYWDGADWPVEKLLHPFGIAVAPDGDVYVTDARKRVVHLGPRGEFEEEWGREGKEPGEFSNSVGIAAAADGSVFVADYDLDRIQKFTPDGEFLEAFGRSGAAPGQFDAPAGLAVSASGDIYVADFYNDRVQKFGPDGAFRGTIGHPGRIGAGALHYPTEVCLTARHRLIVADAYNYQLQWFDTNGRPTRRRGYHFLWLWPRPVSSNAGFNVPTGVTVSPNGLIHVADSGNHRIVMLTAKGEFLAAWRIPHANPRIDSPEHLAVSPDGRTVYATDYAANRIIVLRTVH